MFELSPERQLAGEQALAVVRNAVQELPPKCRQAFLLHRIQELQVDEIAERMHIGACMVRRYISRALEYLRQRVDAAYQAWQGASAVTTQSARGVPYSADQIREATEWFVVIHDEAHLNAETLQSWSRWVDAALGNRLAFEAVSRTWHRVPTSCELLMPTAGELAADEYDADQPVDRMACPQYSTADPDGTACGPALAVGTVGGQMHGRSQPPLRWFSWGYTR